MRRAGETGADAADDRGDAPTNGRAADDAPEADDYADEPAAGEGEEEARGRRRGDVPSRVIDALPGSPQFWGTACLACLIGSAALVLNGQAEAAFVTATLGVLSWFINVRNRLRGDDDEAETGAGGREEEDERNRVRNG